MNFYLQSLNFDQGQIGFINSAAPAALVLLAWPIGWLSDRWGRSRSLLLGTVVQLGAWVGFSLSDSFPVLLALSGLSGAGAAMVGANIAPFMTDHSDEENRVFLFSLQAALLSLTGLFGNLVGGRLPDWTGSLRTTMLAGSLLLGISVLPLLFVGPGRARPQPHTIPAAGSFSLFFKLLLPHGLIGLGAGLVMPFLNLYIKWKFNLDYDELGYLFGFSSVLTAAGIMVQPGLAHRYGKVRAILITQAFSLPFLLILGFVPVFALVCVAMLIRNMLMNMATPITSAFFMEQVPPQRRATLSVMAIMSWNLGWAISTAFSGWFRSLLDPDPGFKLAFGGMAFCYILSIAAFYVFWGRPSRIMHNIECVS